jgi:hypothetical protein
MNLWVLEQSNQQIGPLNTAARRDPSLPTYRIISYLQHIVNIVFIITGDSRS